jgi:O-antigen ligase
LVRKGIIWKYLLAFGIGILVGYSVIPSFLFGAAFIVFLFVCLLYGVQDKMNKFLTYLPFLIYSEVFIRAYLREIPYLSMSYLFITVFLVQIINYNKNKKAHSKAYLFLIGFALLEVINGFFPARPQLLRSIFFSSSTAILAIIWSSFNILSPQTINRILANVKIASLFLAGIIVVAHLRGKIAYGNFSSNEASNGMAPVQISGYLGTACCFFLFGLMNGVEKKNRVINFIAFVTVGVIMVLTFSRGGLYFVAIIAALYMFFNRAQLGNYFKYLIMIPVVIVAFNFVVDETGGAILRRYDDKGSSNRDVLVEASFKLFLEHPILGVGTSNFGTAIVKEKLFTQESTAHNEFARAMAEHGIFGIATYWTYFILTFIALFFRKEPQRQYSIYFLALFCLIVVHNGLKISIQHLLLVLAIANPSINSLNISSRNVTNAIRRKKALQQPA